MATPAIEIAAYYAPLYHVEPRVEQWHGKGWTEWDLVRSARPRFPGHQQPHVPAWGEYDESDPAWSAREIDIAADHAVTAFLYDWYWYDDRPFLNGGLERGFLQAPNRKRMKFALMWANHDWVDLHPAKFTNKYDVLMRGGATREVFDHLTDYVCRRYFTQPNYLLVEGCPYFSIYELGTFLKGMGGVDAAVEALGSFRKRVRAMGFPGLHLNICVWGFSVLPVEMKVADPAELALRLGASSTTSYCWAHHYNMSAGYPTCPYDDAAKRMYEVWEEKSREMPVPYHPNVSMGWDSSPRTVQSDRFEDRGYPWGAMLAGNTPGAFKEALEHAREFVLRPQTKQKFVTLNAWNEWTESSYLLPDTLHGNAYLEAVRDVFGG